MLNEILFKGFVAWGGLIKEIVKLAPRGWEPKPISPRYPCRHFWLDVVINVEGKVLPCCFDYDAKLVLGDLTKQTLSQIWNNNVLKRLRKMQSEGNFNFPLCKDCREWDGFPKEKLFFVKSMKKILPNLRR
jgi:radical SAM protein with 4Fe4S-binding SPASM domain